ncbi:hypothetical protein PC117_g4161 [Phytophthora cactorum]|uniref:Uncharacterized protein n=1 Tax=Phytophthora cactorum TaxID=29920 RepID=A0A8T1EC26_9STRA|nr:hypothetical protein PC117_g4161 [Phytophthora cactorum]
MEKDVNADEGEETLLTELAIHEQQSFAAALALTSLQDTLVTPERYQVDSDEFTIAVNYWWHGVRKQLVADKRMMPYYARVMLEELVNQQCESRLQVLRSEAGTTSNFEDESNAMAAFLAENDQAGRERALLSLNSKVFVTTQRLLTTNYAEDWRRLLANASVDLVAVVTKVPACLRVRPIVPP